MYIYIYICNWQLQLLHQHKNKHAKTEPHVRFVIQATFRIHHVATALGGPVVQQDSIGKPSQRLFKKAT